MGELNRFFQKKKVWPKHVWKVFGVGWLIWRNHYFLRQKDQRIKNLETELIGWKWEAYHAERRCPVKSPSFFAKKAKDFTTCCFGGPIYMYRPWVEPLFFLIFNDLPVPSVEKTEKK
jgi:hypothetical protein